MENPGDPVPNRRAYVGARHPRTDLEEKVVKLFPVL